MRKIFDTILCPIILVSSDKIYYAFQFKYKKKKLFHVNYKGWLTFNCINLNHRYFIYFKISVVF